MSARPYDAYEDTPLWHAVAAVLAELEATGEVKVATAPHYVIGFMCRELAAKWVVASAALARQR